MNINNLVKNFESENTFEGVSTENHCWRPEELKQKAVEMREGGALFTEISEALSISKNTATKWCIKILGRKKANEISKKIKDDKTKENKRKLKELFETDSTLSVKEMSKKLNISANSIYKYSKQMGLYSVSKNLVDMENLSERFTLDEGNGPLPVLKIMLDGEEISYRQLVGIANQLASALSDRGCTFKPMTKH